MTKLSLGQAAKYSNKSKGTISNALNNGNLSGEKVKKNGREIWEIEPSELQRWIDSNRPIEPQEIHATTHKETIENSALNKEIELLREMLEETKADRDSWKEQAQKITGLIENQQTSSISLWKRIIGKK